MIENQIVVYLDRFAVTSKNKCDTKSPFFLMIIKQNIKSFFLYFLFVILFFKVSSAQAQIQNNGDLYIGDNSIVFINAESFDFGIGTTTTSRTKLDYGVLSLSDDASWLGASDLQFIDGYVQTHSTAAFILPLGQSGIYAPMQVIPSTSEGLDAAYFRTPPTSIGSALDASISQISSVEYWDIKSNAANAIISLSWRPSSAISDLTSSSLGSLTIIGWNGSTWVTIPSIVDKSSIIGEISSLTSGSISSNQEIDLSAFSAFSLGATTNKQKFDQIEYTLYISKNELFLEASSRIAAVEIYDIIGNKLLHGKVGGKYNYTIPFEHEEAVYVALIRFEDGISETKKIINSRKIY
jgi:hypothetical protein